MVTNCSKTMMWVRFVPACAVLCSFASVFAQSDDTFAELECTSCPKEILDQDYGKNYGDYTGNGYPTKTVFDARKATWKFENYPRPKKQDYPISIDGVKNGTWCGGSVLGTMDTAAG